MCYMSGSIQMENIYVPENEVGLTQWLFGKSVTSIVLHNTGTIDGFVGIAAPSLARILPVSINTPSSSYCCWCFYFTFDNSNYYLFYASISLLILLIITFLFFWFVDLQIDLAMFGGEILCQVEMIESLYVVCSHVLLRISLFILYPNSTYPNK